MQRYQYGERAQAKAQQRNTGPRRALHRAHRAHRALRMWAARLRNRESLRCHTGWGKRVTLMRSRQPRPCTTGEEMSLSVPLSGTNAQSMNRSALRAPCAL